MKKDKINPVRSSAMFKNSISSKSESVLRLPKFSTQEKLKTSNEAKKIVFFTGTRADFGKIKSLISILQKTKGFETHIFATGMHLNPKYGATVREIESCGFGNIYKFINHSDYYNPDVALSETIRGFSNFVKVVRPNMIVVHGDRIEALGCAVVGASNNILVAHIEGGEITGSVDEHIRHAISKLSHCHFVANDEAKRRLFQMGEREETIFIIGSPDIDIMTSPDLPSWTEVKKRYKVTFDDFGLLIFHPVTTELENLLFSANQLADAVLESGLNYIVIYPNNDPGTDIIFNVYKEKLFENPLFLSYPSLRFEHFLSLLKKSRFIIGNSSAGIREAPYYGVPAINVGSRQNGRIKNGIAESVRHCDCKKKDILGLIKKIIKSSPRYQPTQLFGSAGSDKKFLNILLNHDKIWKMKVQKQFSDIDF